MQIKLGDFLREICIKTVVNNEYPVLTSSKNGIYLQSEYFNKQVASKDNTGYKIIKKGQFTYRAMSDTGEFYPNMLKCVDVGIVSPAYPVFEITNRDIIYPQYLQYFFRSNTFRYNISGLEQGSTRTSIKFNKMKNIKIKLPPLLEQKKVIMILDRVGSLISKRQEQLKYFDELTKSLFIEMFGDPISNPKEWKKKKCKNILTKIGSGATPQGGSESYKEEGISLIRSMNVHNGRFESKDLAYIDEKQAQKLDNVNIKENDVLINITGASVARCCIVPSDVIPARVNQHVSVLRCSDMVNSIFLCYQIINDSYQNLLKKIGTSGGATREAITKKQIEDLEVILPPIELQNKFANFVRGTDKSKLAVKKSLEELEILKKSLMQKYFA